MIPEAAVEAAVDAALAVRRQMHVNGTAGRHYQEIVAALEAAAPHLGRIITTAEDLDSLPNGSVVLSDIYLHYLNAQRISFQRWENGLWYRGARSADTHPDNFLPATVIHVPEPAK